MSIHHDGPLSRLLTTLINPTCGSRAAVGRRDSSDNLVRPETNPGVPQSSAGLLAFALSL
eukprot:2964606-Prymnesium_polylepis.2